MQNNTDCTQPVIDIELSRQYPAVWKAMEAMVNSGKALAIGASFLLQKLYHNSIEAPGLSNFNILKTKKILESARIRPVVNQVEVHP